MKKRQKEEIKMMNFVVMTLSFTVAILLASFIACMIVLNKRVVKWYLKKVNALTMDAFEEISELYAVSEVKES